MLHVDFSSITWDEKGLIPAVIQDSNSKQVLMVAYMNEESLKRTIETKETWFWSRSRKELWHKGETSGNLQKVKDIKLDCDHDTLLVLVDQVGVACHTGTYSCFGHKDENKVKFDIIEELIEIIKERKKSLPEGSYTTYLFEKGLDKILKKVGEEASEVIIAAKNPNLDELTYEVSDLIYHVLVLLELKHLPFEEILNELARRHHKDQNPD